MEIEVFIEIKVLVQILHNQGKGNSHAKGSKGPRVVTKMKRNIVKCSLQDLLSFHH